MNKNLLGLCFVAVLGQGVVELYSTIAAAADILSVRSSGAIGYRNSLDPPGGGWPFKH